MRAQRKKKGQADLARERTVKKHTSHEPACKGASANLYVVAHCTGILPQTGATIIERTVGCVALPGKGEYEARTHRMRLSSTGRSRGLAWFALGALADYKGSVLSHNPRYISFSTHSIRAQPGSTAAAATPGQWRGQAGSGEGSVCVAEHC